MTLFMQALTTTANAKRWLGVTGTTDDDIFNRLVQSASGFIRGWLNRDIVIVSYADMLDGNGSTRLNLPNNPIVSVDSLLINGVDVPKIASPMQPGYAWTNTQIVLDGYRFTKGVQNIDITYTAGYSAQESVIVADTNAVAGLWSGDISVTIGGTVIDSSLYTVTDGVYTIDSQFLGQSALIRYGSIPYEIEQATLDIIGRKYRERERIGHVSKSLAGETVTFSQSDMSADTKGMLSQYRRVAPA